MSGTEIGVWFGIAGCLWAAYFFGIDILRNGVDGGFDVTVVIFLVILAGAMFKGMYWPNPGGSTDSVCKEYGRYGIEVCR